MKVLLIFLGLLVIYVETIHLRFQPFKRRDDKKLLNSLGNNISYRSLGHTSDYTIHDDAIQEVAFSLHFRIAKDKLDKEGKPFVYEHGTIITKTKLDNIVCLEIVTTENSQTNWMLEISDGAQCENKLNFKPIIFKIEKKLTIIQMINGIFKNYCQKVPKLYHYDSLKEVNSFKNYLANLEYNNANCLSYVLYNAEQLDRTLKLKEQVKTEIVQKAEQVWKELNNKH